MDVILYKGDNNMLPFARMLEYGNTIKELSIVNVIGGTLSAFILYSDGRLYGAGSNLNGELGLGNYTGWNGATPKWTLVDTDVTEVYGGCKSVGVVYRKSNEYYYRGNASALGISGSYYYNATSFNINNYIPVGFTVRNIVMSANGIRFLVKENDGTDSVYGVGSGNLMGQNSNQNRYILTKLTGINTTSIKEIGINDNAFYYLSTAGDMYGTGTNVSNQLSTSTTGTIHLTFLLQSSGVKTMSIGNDNYLAQLSSNPLSLYGRGQNSLHAISQSSVTSLTTFSIITNGLSSLQCKLISSGTYGSGFINDNGTISAIGNSVSYLASGTTGAAVVYTRYMPSVTDFTNYSTAYNNAFFGSGTNWYMVTQTTSTGIVGSPQTNGTYKIPLDLS